MIFPNLKNEKKIALDLETRDPNLTKLGANAARDNSYILGAAIAVKDREWYFSFNHPNSENTKLSFFVEWLKENNHLLIVNHNITYDLDFLYTKGNYIVPNNCADTMVMEALTDENQESYSLDALGKKYFGIGKEKTEIESICEANGWKGDPRQYLYLIDGYTTGKYAKKDVRLAYDIHDILLPIISAQSLDTVFDLECRLIPFLMLLKRNGQRIDREKIPIYSQELSRIEIEAQDRINQKAGWEVNVNSGKQLRKFFDDNNIRYFLKEPTEKMKAAGKPGNASFDEKFLENCSWPYAEDILVVRKNGNVKRNFVEGLEKFCIGDRIHGSFHSTVGTYGGARTGRFSASHPNLENIPASKVFKKYTRSLFIPEENRLLSSGDYKGIEFILLAHYARGEKSEELLNEVLNNPAYDPHDTTSKLAGIDRDQAKTCNYMIMYGGGAARTSAERGISLDEAKEFLYGPNGFHSKMPFLKKTMRDCSDAAVRRGYIKTAIGRRRRLTDKYYRALNAVIQGTAAEILKTALVLCYESGLYGELWQDELITPHNIVHDETVKSVPESENKYIPLLLEEKNIMEHSLEMFTEGKVKLKVPIKFTQKIGRNWYDMEKLKL